MTNIADDCFLVMSEYGIQRMTKRKAGLKRGEIAVRVRLVVPERCFDEPDVSAEIVVPESAIIQPEVKVEVLDAPNPAEG